MAAWWVILPINFDTLYEVHLFTVIPVMCAAVVILGKPGPWRRGASLGLLLATGLLMRNELLLSAALLAAMLLFVTIWRARHSQAQSLFNVRSAAAYVVPVAGVLLVTALYYRHASDAGSISAVLERKHTLNICQTYAFGYQQRHEDFNKSPWTECQELMSRVYGKPEPPLTEALIRNPRAMVEHFVWNVSLIPSGLQVLLLNVTSGGVNPDYAPVLRSWIAWPPTVILLAIAVAGIIRLRGNLQSWWVEWIRPRVWGWSLLLVVAAAAIGVIVTQRPRPSYMLSLGILLRAVAGMLVLALVNRPAWRQRMLAAFPVVAVLAVALAPSFYDTILRSQPRPLVKAYERLAGYANLLHRRGAALVSPGYCSELCNYVGKGACHGLDYPTLRALTSPEKTWPKVLEAAGATLIYADEGVLGDPAGQDLVKASVASGWQTLAFDNVDGQRWMLLGRREAGKSALGVTPAPSLPPLDDIPVVGDWNGDGTAKVGIFRRGIWYLDTDGSHQLPASKAIGWGQEGDIPVVGDWNGDGRTKIGVYSKGVWFLDIDGSHRMAPAKLVRWGEAGDTPVLGDWDKSGKTKVGVFRSSTWLLDTSGTHHPAPADRFTVDVK
jgi:hypothetical protein